MEAAAGADLRGNAAVRVLGFGVRNWVACAVAGTTIALATAYGVIRHGDSPRPSASYPAVPAAIDSQGESAGVLRARRPIDRAAEASHAPSIESPQAPSPAAPPAQTARAPGYTSRKSTGPAPRPAASADLDSSSAPSLAAELSSIETARAAVREGRARDAIGVLDEYQARFPRGAFEEEAAVLRIEALALGGETARASRVAHTFLETHPRSPYRSRVQRTLSSLEARESR
jgi:TolA-binding protein